MPRPTVSPNPATQPQTAMVVVASTSSTLRRSLARLLLRNGFEVMTAEDADTALQLLDQGKVRVLVADLHMTPVSGDALLHRARQRHPDVVRLLVVGSDQLELGMAALTDDVFDVLVRPWLADEMVVLSVRRAVEHARLMEGLELCRRKAEVAGGVGSVTEILGRGTAMRQVRQVLKLAVHATVPLLLVGEAGTGKQTCARWVHDHGSREVGPWVVATVAGGDPRVVEEALFSPSGWLFQARGGTLYIDELSAVPVDVQGRLAGWFDPGRKLERDRGHDVRLIVGSTRSVSELRREERIHPAMDRILHTLVTYLPPLRQRKEDIPTLAHFFAQEAAQRLDRPFQRIGVEALRLLREHPWPGNLAELHDAMDRAVVWMRGQVMRPGDLVAAGVLGQVRASGDSWAPTDVFDAPFSEAKQRVVQAFEKTYVEIVLEKTAGVVAEAARLARLDRSNFRRLLKRTGVKVARKAGGKEEDRGEGRAGR